METTENENVIDLVPPPVGKNGEKSSAAVAQSKQDDSTLHDWLQSISPNAPFRIQVHRKSPKLWKNKQVGGLLSIVDEPIDEAEIQRQWGGGTFTVKVLRQRTDGAGYLHVGQRTFDIAGEPIMGSGTDIPLQVSQAPSESDLLSKRAMEMTEKMAERAQLRAERIEEQAREQNSRPAFDPTFLEAVMGPMRETNRMLAEQVAAMQARLDAPKENHTGRLLEKFIEGDSSRIDHLRANHESEIRQLREQHRDDVKRSEDRMQRHVEEQARAHEREVASLRAAYESQIKMQEIAFSTQVKTIESSLVTTREELQLAKKELVDLRAKKDQPVEDQLKRFLEMKEMFEALSGGNEEESPVWRQVVDAFSESPIAQAMAARVAGPPPGTGGPPAGVPPAQVQAAMAAAKAKQLAQQNPNAIRIEPADLAIAVKFLEGAVTNGTDPATFVQSARSMIPSGILQAIKIHGINVFLQNVKLDDNSNLLTVKGRNFLRKVAELLVGDSGEETTLLEPAPAAETTEPAPA